MKTLTMDELIRDYFTRSNRPAIRRAMAKGLPGKKIGREYYFDEQAVRDWLSRRDATQREAELHRANVKRVRVARQEQVNPGDFPDEVGEC